MLKEADFTLYLKKFEFFKVEIKYRARSFWPERLKMLRKNVEAIEKAEKDRKNTQMRCFLRVYNA